MGKRRAEAWWWVAGALALSATGGGTAWADMIYFKNGTSMWGEETEVEGDQVLLTRGGRTLRFPMADVERVEKKRTNMPDYRVDAPPPGALPSPPVGPPARGGPGGPPVGPAGTSPPAGGPTGPAGAPQGALAIPSGGPQGVIPIPGAGPAPGGGVSPQYEPPGPPPGPPLPPPR